MSKIAIGLSLVLLAGRAGPARASEPAVIKVGFRLAEATYRTHFDNSSATLGALEARAAEGLSAVLGRRCGFLRFTGNPADAAEYGLQFVLDARSLAEKAPLREVGFRVSAHGPEGEIPQASAYASFRSAQEWLVRIGTVDELVREIEAKTDTADFQDLLARDVLRRIPIAKKAILWTNPPGFILPFRDRELCMGQGTRLVVRNNLPTAVGPETVDVDAEARLAFNPPTATPPPYEQQRMNVFARADRADWLGGVDPQKVDVIAIFVAKYLDLGGACRGPLSPEDAFPQP